MYKRTIFPFLIILDPFAFIEQHKKDKSSLITAQKFYEIEKHKIHIVDHLFKSNEKKTWK